MASFLTVWILTIQAGVSIVSTFLTMPGHLKHLAVPPAEPPTPASQAEGVWVSVPGSLGEMAHFLV